MCRGVGGSGFDKASLLGWSSYLSLRGCPDIWREAATSREELGRRTERGEHHFSCTERYLPPYLLGSVQTDNIDNRMGNGGAGAARVGAGRAVRFAN